SIEGPFFFGAVENLERALAQTHADPRCIIIRLNRVPFMDITGIQALEEATQNLERRGVRVLLCDARPNVVRKLVRAGLARRGGGPRRYLRDFGTALRACDSR
ncbi:MAG TPA: sodium-independent anion transporter, partial [Nevskia sp.]|nr:sodium-independent anion transporter [Nevskia sp.]